MLGLKVHWPGQLILLARLECSSSTPPMFQNLLNEELCGRLPHSVMSSRLISRHILLQGTPLAGPMYCSLRGRSDFWESATAISCSFLGFMDTEEHSWDHLFNILTISQTSLFQKEFLFRDSCTFSHTGFTSAESGLEIASEPSTLSYPITNKGGIFGQQGLWKAGWSVEWFLF